jgi:hypothetical protein
VKSLNDTFVLRGLTEFNPQMDPRYRKTELS